MASTDLGTLLLRLAADAGQFESDLGRAARIADKRSKEIEKAFGKVGAVIGAALAAAAGVVAGLTKQAIDSADALDEMAQRVGSSAKELSTLAFAAQRGAVELGTLESSMVKLTKNASEAAQGIGTAQQGFDALGISVSNADGSLKSSDALLKEVAGALSQYKDGAEKTALAVNLFGKAGAAMIPMLNQGAEGIELMQQRARDLGLELSNATAALAGEFNDNMADLQSLAKGFGNDLATALLPGLVGLTTELVNGGIEARKFGNSAETIASVVKGVITVILNAIGAVQKFGAMLGAAAQQIDVFFGAIAKNIGAYGQYLKDIVDIGPYDAFAKFVQTGFKNVGQSVEGARLNLDALNDTFEDIDRSTRTKVDALNRSLSETAGAVNDPGKGAAPALIDYEKAAKAAAAAAEAAGKAQAENNRIWQQSRDELAETTLRWKDFASQNAAYFAQQEKDLLTEIRLLGLNTRARNAEIIALRAEEMARDSSGRVIEEQAAKYRELLTELQRMEEVRAISDEATGYFEEFAFSVLDDFGGIGDAFDKLADNLGNMAKRAVAQMIAEFAQLQVINPLLNSIFGTTLQTGGGGGIGGIFSQIGSLFGGGGSAGGGGFLSQLGSVFGMGGASGGGGIMSTIGSFFGMGGGGTAAAGAGGAASGGMAGFAGIPVVGWILAGMALNDRMFSEGWTRERQSTTLPNGQTVSGGGNNSALGNLVTAGMVNGLDSALQRLGLSDRIASLLSGSSLHARLFGRKKPRLTNGETTFDFGADGVSGMERYRTLEEGGLFRSDRRRWHQFGLSGDSMEAAQAIFDELRAVMVAASERLRADAPDMIDASLRIVQEFDKKGKVKATKYFVDIIGRSWEEATAELAQTRLSAEAIIASIDAAFGNTVSEDIADAIADPVGDGIEEGVRIIRDRIDSLMPKVVQTMGEASAIAERWRDDAELLMEGAQFLLSVATDMRAGFDLLGTGTLTPIVDLVEELAHEGEALIDTYTRLAMSTKLFEDALALMGVEMGLSREELVRFATDITEAAGGLQQAADLWASFFGNENFFSDTERMLLALERAFASAATELEDIGLVAGDFAGSGGMARFRALFESVLPTLTAEQVVQWLEAARALSAATDANNAYNEALRATAGAAGEAAESMADVWGVLWALGAKPGDASEVKPGTPWAPDYSGGPTRMPVDPIVMPDSPWTNPDGGGLYPIDPGVQDQIEREIERRYQMELDWLQRLMRLQDSLLLNEQLTTLTPAERLAEIERQYNEAYTAAMGGDEAARAIFDGLATQFAEIGRSYFGSDQRYTDLFNRIQSDIGGLIAASPITVGGQITAAAMSPASASMQTTAEVQRLREQDAEIAEAQLAKLDRLIELMEQANMTGEEGAQTLKMMRVSGKQRVGA